MIDLNSVIKQAGEMEPFRPSTVRLAQLVNSQNFHLSDVMDLIAYDQVLTMKLMRAANSAAHVDLEPVVTPQEAVTRLGTTMVLALAVAAGVRLHMQRRIDAYGLDEGALWRHSVIAAVAAQTAPQFCSTELPPESFTVALLHDIGKVVMGRFLSAETLLCIAQCKASAHLSQTEAESEILGVHHGELGGLIAQHWQLSQRTVQGIIHHHDPSQGRDIVCDLAYLANQAAVQVERGLGGQSMDLVLMPGVTERLGLRPTQLGNFCSAAAGRFLQVSQCYNAV